VTTDANRDVPVVVGERGIVRDRLLHALGRGHRVVGLRKRRHDLVAHGLDDAAAIDLGRLAHDLEAAADHLPGLYVTELFIKLRAAHHIGEQNGNLHIPTHGVP
jgi:hypothetical protein